jgi:hypothetical protein
MPARKMSSRTLEFGSHRTAAAGAARTPFRLPVYIGFTLASLVLNYAFGKETAFDSLHYHFYDGFSALNDRFGVDYFAAGAQSYFNPYAYVPFYVLVKLGLPALAVGSVLAAIQSVALWITYELACAICPSASRWNRFFFGLCASTLALMNPILLQEIGSSFADLTTTPLVLGGWLLLARAIEYPSARRIMAAAIMLGCAAALKPTNGLHAICAFFVLAFVRISLRERLKASLYFAAVLGASFTVFAAPWAYRLAIMFGNPFFPLMNGIFKSAEFTTEPLKHYRFVPDSFNDALSRPFDIMDGAPMIHSELSAPDIRYVFLLITFVVIAIAKMWQRRSRPDVPRQERFTVSSRAVAALGLGFSVDWLLWLGGSGNSRYFIPMACVAGVIALALLFKLLENHTLGRNGILCSLLAGQLTLLTMEAQIRSDAIPWRGRWFNVSIPPKLAREPNLYLSIGLQSNSFIVPYLAKGSSFVNFAGVFALGPEGENATRVKALIERSRPHVRVIVSGAAIYPDSARLDPQLSDIDETLRMFGLRVDTAECDAIAVQGVRVQIQRPLMSSIPAPPLLARGTGYTRSLATCHVVDDDRDFAAEKAGRRSASLIFDRLEDACPRLFIPRRNQTEHEGDAWLRRYPQTDLIAVISRGEVSVIDAVRGIRSIPVGTEARWAAAAVPLECERHHGIYTVNPVATAR